MLPDAVALPVHPWKVREGELSGVVPDCADSSVMFPSVSSVLKGTPFTFHCMIAGFVELSNVHIVAPVYVEEVVPMTKMPDCLFVNGVKPNTTPFVFGNIRIPSFTARKFTAVCSAVILRLLEEPT